LPSQGQNTRVTFTGKAGQRVSLGVEGAFNGGVTLLKPDGSKVIEDWTSDPQDIQQAAQLPVDGDYTFLLTPRGALKFDLTLTITSKP